MMKRSALFLCLAGFVASDSFAAPVCDIRESFVRRADDQRPNKRVAVFEERTPLPNGVKPLMFVTSQLQVNTDGTRRSYHVTDTEGRTKAINKVSHAMSNRSIPDFEALRDADWQPPTRARSLLGGVIEFDNNTNKPCIDAQGYLVSMTSVVSRQGAWNEVGDCDQSKWLDALAVPAIVLPRGDLIPGTTKRAPTEFDRKDATNRSIVVVAPVAFPDRATPGIVGDKGPETKLGEASVAMNATLNNLAPGTVPNNYADAVSRFTVRSHALTVVFPGAIAKLGYPITAERAKEEGQKLFDAWGGQEKVQACIDRLRRDRVIP